MGTKTGFPQSMKEIISDFYFTSHILRFVEDIFSYQLKLKTFNFMEDRGVWIFHIQCILWCNGDIFSKKRVLLGSIRLMYDITFVLDFSVSEMKLLIRFQCSMRSVCLSKGRFITLLWFVNFTIFKYNIKENSSLF